MFDNNNVLEHENRDVAPMAQPQVGIRVHIDFLEIDVQGAELGRHLLAEMAALAAVKPGRAFNLYR
jgi:hypothetical protein